MHRATYHCNNAIRTENAFQIIPKLQCVEVGRYTSAGEQIMQNDVVTFVLGGSSFCNPRACIFEMHRRRFAEAEKFRRRGKDCWVDLNDGCLESVLHERFRSDADA